ncbi:MAG: PIN/TRAM domain-containing protein [Bacillota bacterium]|nr:PIN/TRAM domain-containing protein [Bacillota bacterium]
MVLLVRIVLGLIGGFLGYSGALFVLKTGVVAGFIDNYLIGVFALVGTLLGVVVALPVFKGLQMGFNSIVRALVKTPITDLLGGLVGLVIGWLLGLVISLPVARIPVVGVYAPIFFGLVFGSLGLIVGLRKREDFLQVFFRSSSHIRKRQGLTGQAAPKILDTSVIIDGRISDITRSGFLEGDLIVPGFVLEELQHIADSSDVLKRNRGRRGLDILNKIQKEPYSTVRILEQDYEDVTEVDTKLVKLAKELNGKVVTNDYNLNKVCELHGVPVLNINELANSVKPVVLPGEELKVNVIKDGKEQGQGVAYLDDGTMIVVDGGRRYIGQTVGVLVTSVLQTAAGRMIFAKPKSMERAL